MNISKKLKDKNNLLTRGMASTFIKVLGALTSYVLSFLIAQKYGAEGNGVFALFMTYIIILSTFFYLGLDFFLVKEISSLINEGKNDQIKNLYITILRSYIFPFSLLLLCSALFLYFFLDLTIYSLVAVGIILNVFIDINSAIFRGMKKAEWFSFFTQFSKYFILVLLFLVPSNYGDSDGILFLYLLSLLINGVFSWLVLRRAFRHITSKNKAIIGNKYSIQSIFKISKEFFFSSIIIITLVWMDFIFIDLFLNKDEAGVYSVALKIATLISFSFTAFNAFLAPRISELHSSGQVKSLQKLITHNFVITFPMVLIPFLMILFFNEDLLGFFGSEFVSGTTVLIWLALGQLINCIFGPVSLLLQMTNHQRLFQNILITSLFIKSVSAFLFVHFFGLEGIAAASFIGLALWTILGSYYVNKKIGINSWFGVSELKFLFYRILK